MKPNPEQDADRAAFEKFLLSKEFLDETSVHVGIAHSFQRLCPKNIAKIAWQAAKADSRAMEDALEQVCVVLEENTEQMGLLAKNPISNPWLLKANVALSLAAPFRKTGV